MRSSETQEYLCDVPQFTKNFQVFILICLASVQLKIYVLNERLTILGTFIIHTPLVTTAQNGTLSSNKANTSEAAD